ncbi:MAG: acyl-CoA synthetase (AMP-forming)/AMP-acid ligase II [Rhodothermales bacterium]|jgi:acyl-CoA synthetase (AMP-forming)/AMP-acid ligase II
MERQVQGRYNLEVEELPVRLNLGQALEQAAGRWSDRVGWVFDDERVTFTQMQNLSRAYAAVLHKAGAGEGDLTAVWLPNVPEWAYTFFGSAMSGGLMASMSTRWTTPEAEHVLRHSNARVLIFQPRFLNIDFCALLAEIYPEYDTVLQDLSKGPDAERPHLIPLHLKTLTCNDIICLDEIDDQSSQEIPQRDVDPDQPFLVQYTSGSTGRPKGALLSQIYCLNWGLETWMRLGVRSDEAFLNTQPFYHVGGSIGALPSPILLGCTMVTPEYYSPQRVMELIETEHCVSRGGMSTMYLREMELPGFRNFNTSSMRTGWTVAPPGVMDRIRSEYPLAGLVQVYGSSECGSFSSYPSDPWKIRRRTVGFSTRGTDFAILHPDSGESLESDEIGEICIRGVLRLLEYYRDDEATKSSIDTQGWFHTQDLGRVDAQGRLFYEGRLKEMIKPGGENVSALEVETVISSYPGVHQVAVIGIPDPDLGEAIVAVIELIPGSTVIESDLIKFCSASLAKYKIPKRIYFIEQMPLTDSGKIKKQSLQEFVT